MLLLTGCAVETDPLTPAERNERVQSDLLAMFANQEPITRPLTVYDVMARAVKYNLDNRTKAMETAISQGIADATSFDMLPELVGNAGYTIRSNEAGSTSNEDRTAARTQGTTAQEADLSMTWNILDFGVSYLRARQQADRVHIAEERRRKIIQNILQDARTSYWRAVAADRLAPKLDRLITRVEDALDRSRQIERQRLEAPVQALEFQKQLLDTMNRLLNLRRQVSFARLELSALMNVEPTIEFDISVPDIPKLDFPDIIDDVAFLEQAALLNRPELREEDYQQRISANETRKEILRLLPGIEFSVGGNYDDNPLLFNNKWAEAGARMTWNLFNLVSGYSRIDLAETQEDLAETRRQALSMAILTQVHIAYRRYRQSLIEFNSACEISLVDTRLLRHIEAETLARRANELRLITQATSALFAQLQRDFAYAEFQAAVGSVFNAVGGDLFPETVESVDVLSLSQALQGTFEGRRSGPRFQIPDGGLGSVLSLTTGEAKTDCIESIAPESTRQSARREELAEAPAPPSPPPPSPPRDTLSKLVQDIVGAEGIFRDVEQPRLPVRRGRGGGPALQIASFSNIETAERGREVLLDRFPDLEDYPLVIAPAEIPGRGTFYRIYVEGGRDDLIGLCGSLRDRGGSCIFHRQRT